MRKSLFLLPLLSLSIAGLVACSNNKDDVAGGPGSITTNGLALIDGQPASYATVALRKVDYKEKSAGEVNALVIADSYADEKGNFKVEIPADGKYRLTVAHDGVAYSRVLTRNEFAEAGVSLKPDTVRLEPTAVLAGVVDVPEGSSTVWVGIVGTDVLVKTDESGWFALSSIPANDSLQLYFVNEDFDKSLGEKDLFVTPMESIMQDYREAVVPEDTTPEDTVEPEKLLQVLALLKDGTPATYATVALRAADAKVEDYAVQNSMVESELRTDKNGRFEMEWPDSGDYRLTVTKDGFAYSKVYKAKDLAKLDTLRLEATASISSKVTLRTGEEFLWVGVYGLDLLVKTNDAGSYVLPSVPAKDSLDIYFVIPDSANTLYAEWKAIADPYNTKFSNPVMVLQDFEDGIKSWYVNTDALFKGTTLTPMAKNVADGIVYDSTRKSKVFHGEYKLADDDYAWVLVGMTFEYEMNFSAIDSVVFYAKGDGNIRLSLENYINDNKSLKAATEWLPLTKDWQRISVNPAELCVGNAKTETCFTSWSGVKYLVKQLHIFPQDGTEFYIDDVTLYGALF
ncbi:carboxypeptidase-like regulatory domain-containing protein [Fibrobacter succinogenes]|uniref:carboxypeptidase-like regulatory domain-containing protein n=1 Tax=Fibrobacter succinogenes TaxID=833 RepID=UPI0013D15C18|nr:carboxypeptidase-like regulatory domain-containing protein [Fibrobacter succinogenes]